MPLAQPAAAAASAVPDWLADLFPGPPAPAAAPARPQAATPMEVPLQLVPLLTANGNEALTRICALSGAEIALRQDMQHLGYSLAIITGTAQATALAKDMVMMQIGLTGGSIITKEVEVSGDPSRSAGAVELVLAELRQKAMGVQVSVVPPKGPGERGRISIGPGPVAHIAVAETLVRKKLADIELDLCYRQGRPVPPELKIPVLCKFFELGSCSLAGKCQYCHGKEEREVARRMAMPPGAAAERGAAAAVTAAAAPAAASASAAEGRTSETSALL